MHNLILLTRPEAHTADLQPADAHSRSTASSRPLHRLRALALALALAASSAIAPTGALAQPAHDPATAANEHAQAVHCDRTPSAPFGSITFTNPLGRSRGPGTGGGQL